MSWKKLSQSISSPLVSTLVPHRPIRHGRKSPMSAAQMTEKETGIIQLKVKKARNLLRKDKVLKQKPILVVECNNQFFRSGPGKSSQKNPVWNDACYDIVACGESLAIGIGLWGRNFYGRFQFLGCLCVPINLQDHLKDQNRDQNGDQNKDEDKEFGSEKEKEKDEEKEEYDKYKKNNLNGNYHYDDHHHMKKNYIVKKGWFKLEKRSYKSHVQGEVYISAKLFPNRMKKNSETILKEKEKVYVCSACSMTIREYHQMFHLDCNHYVCENCLSSQVIYALSRKNAKIFCPVHKCKCSIAQWVLRIILNQQEFETHEQDVLNALIENSSNLFRCANEECNIIIERIEDLNISEETDMNKQTRNYKKYRFRCRSCKSEFCAKCKSMPYHLGMTCGEYVHYISSKKCRYCQEALQITSSESATLSSKTVSSAATAATTTFSSSSLYTCFKPECQRKFSEGCQVTLKCGHLCCGIKEDFHYGHLNCLHPKCVDLKSNYPCEEFEFDRNQNENDFCGICYTEQLYEAPCIQLACGHIFHHECVSTKLQAGWHTAAITFGFCECPLCKKTVKHPMVRKKMQQISSIKKKVKAMALERLMFENLANTSEITKKSGKYYNKPARFAIDRYAYYMCYKCQQPYFAGQKSCREDEREGYKRKEMICGGCSGGILTEKCKKHGNTYIEFKCRFCCSVGTWFCWGSCHFCDSCHKKQHMGPSLLKMPKTAFTRCKSKESCPLNVKHPHVEEFCLGCSMCKHLSTF